MTIGAFCIIENSPGNFLLCHRTDKDLWNLPGGRVEQSESPWAAAVREVKEETGLDVEIMKLIGCYFKEKENDLVFLFLAHTINDKAPIHTDECDNFAYYNLQNLPPNTAPKQKDRLLKYYTEQNNEVVLLNQ